MPEELRKCHELEQLILIYTKIQSVPDWAREFHKLEYLYAGCILCIDGRFERFARHHRHCYCCH